MPDYCPECASTDDLPRAFMGSAVCHVGRHGRFLATREHGRAIRERMEALPSRLPVILDFAGVEAMTGAFADELLGKAMGWSRRWGCTGMSDDVREPAETVYRRRTLRVPGA